MSTKNLSAFELTFGVGEHRFAHICKSSERNYPSVSTIACYSHTLKFNIFGCHDCIYDMLKVYSYNAA